MTACHQRRCMNSMAGAASDRNYCLQINRLIEEKRAVMDQLEDAGRQLKKRDDELVRLRRENDMLRDEVCACVQ